MPKPIGPIGERYFSCTIKVFLAHAMVESHMNGTIAVYEGSTRLKVRQDIEQRMLASFRAQGHVIRGWQPVAFELTDNTL